MHLLVGRSLVAGLTTTIPILQADWKLVMCVWLLNYLLWKSGCFNFSFFSELNFNSQVANTKKKKSFQYMRDE